jgi:hypothetical protein
MKFEEYNKIMKDRMCQNINYIQEIKRLELIIAFYISQTYKKYDKITKNIKFGGILEFDKDCKRFETLIVGFPDIEGELIVKDNSKTKEIDEYIDKKLVLMCKIISMAQSLFDTIYREYMNNNLDVKIETLSQTLSLQRDHLEIDFRLWAGDIYHSLGSYILDKEISMEQYIKCESYYLTLKTEVQKLINEIKDFTIKNNLYIYEYLFLTRTDQSLVEKNKQLLEENERMKKQLYL